MGQSVGDLFINIAVQGSDKSAQALVSVKAGLSNVASVGLEAKAAILAMFYGLEQLMSKSDSVGASLKQFATYTGESAEELQRWQKAGLQFNVTADEIAGTADRIKRIMTDMATSGGNPQGLNIFARTGVSFDRNKAMQDSFYVMKQLREVIANAMKDPSLGIDWVNKAIESFGGTKGFITAARQGAYSDENLARQQIYHKSEYEALAKTNGAWARLGDKIEMAFGRMNAKHGQELIKDLSALVKVTIDFADALDKIAAKIGVFKFLDKLPTGLKWIAEAEVSGAKAWAELSKRVGEEGSDIYARMLLAHSNNVAAGGSSWVGHGGTGDFLSPKVAPVNQSKVTNNNNVTVVAKTEDPHALGKTAAHEIHKQNVKNAYHQLPK